MQNLLAFCKSNDGAYNWCLSQFFFLYFFFVKRKFFCLYSLSDDFISNLFEKFYNKFILVLNGHPTTYIMYTKIHLFMHTCTCISVYVHVHTLTYRKIWTYIYMYMYPHLCVCICTHIDIYLCLYVLTCIHLQKIYVCI